MPSETLFPTDPSGLDPARVEVIKREPDTLIWRWVGPDGSDLVTKLYRHRGLVSALRELVTRFRAEREFLRLQYLVARGVACTVPVNWAHGFGHGQGFHEQLVTREVPGAVQLAQHLSGRRDSDLRSTDAAAAELAPLFGLVRRMHEAGFCHQTLYARNILVRADAPLEDRYFISDVPRSWVFPASIVGTPMAWFDLLDLTHSLLELGIPPEAVPVEAYGAVEAAASGRTLAMLRAAPDARSRWSRLHRDAEVRVRWTAAWVRAWVGV